MVEKGFSITVGGDIAAVKEDIPGFTEGITPTGHGIAVVLQSVAVQPAVTQVDLTVSSVGDEMHGQQVRAICENVTDLLDAVLIAVEHHHLDDPVVITLLQTVDQTLIVGHVVINKYQLAPYVRIQCVGMRFGIRCGILAIAKECCGGNVGDRRDRNRR